uniref:Gamma-tubulin complex component n=1 Tax=Trichobilharzia regenti TaxID=157069 RepID=A0AA85JQJ5_TRIRE|nr:unnamed protein product [Trichobilharzia regenti]
MCNKYCAEFYSDSSSSETYNSKSSEEEITKVIQKCNRSYPIRWDQLPPRDVRYQNDVCFSFISLCKSLQPLYWFKEYSTSLTVECTKNLWLSLKGVTDDRYELTEYQIIREVIWVLLGAKKSFVSQMAKRGTTEVGFKSRLVCVNHLSFNALDSLLREFSSWNEHISFLRYTVQFVVREVDFISQPCAFSFADCLNVFLSQLDEFLNKLEGMSRGCGTFTLLSLCQCLTPWFYRVKIISKIVRDVTNGNMMNMQDARTIAKLLDKLYCSANFIEDCRCDHYVVCMLRSAFIFTFHPLLYSLVHLLSGSASYTDSFVKLFVDIDCNITPNDPEFWHSAMKPKINELGTPDVPQMFIPVFDKIVDGLKALFLLISICENIRNYSFLEKVAVDPSRVYKSFPPIYSDFLSGKRKLRFDFESHEYPVRQQTCFFDRSCDSIKFLKSDLESFVHEQIASINQQLLKIVIVPHSISNSLRGIGSCLATAGAVYLFGSGDTMNDFARQVFEDFRSREGGKLCSFELTASLQEYLTDSSKTCQGLPAFRHIESSFLTFSFQNADSLSHSLSEKLGLDLIKDLTLDYCIDWPANIILDENSVEVYNGVFLFLFQLFNKLCGFA